MSRTRASGREERRIDAFIEISGKEPHRWIDYSYEVEGPYFYCVVSLAVCGSQRWKSTLRLEFLRRLLATAHVRSLSAVPNHGTKLASKQAKDWTVYKSAAVFWSLVDQLYTLMFKVRRDLFLVKGY